MKNFSKLQISTPDLDQSESHHPFPLWTGPSSPPFHHPPPLLHSRASSPSSPSDFEFGSIAPVEIKDDLPISPKLTSTRFWGTAALPYETLVVPDLQQTNSAPASHPVASIQQARPSTSVRQLMAEEMCGEHDDDFDFDFYFTPRASLPTPPTNSARDLEQKPLSDDERPPSIAARGQRRKSNRTLSDRLAHDEFTARPKQKNQLLQLCKSEPHSCSASWAPSSIAWERIEEEKSGGKKQGNKIGMKWAFKDLLRKTVPSSKAEAHYITRTMGASSSKKYLSSTKSSPNISPLASPMHYTSSSTMIQSSRPSMSGGRSGSSTPARSSPRHPSTPGHPLAHSLNHTPTPSPPRSPLSPHAIHYQQNKAQSLELTRKTFLPYRQSLLGCLGGPSAFPSEQQAW